MRKIAVNLTKGGVGKSVTAVNLSAGLALEGYRVLLIDTDTQGQVSAMLGVDHNMGLSKLIRQEGKPDETILTARKNLWLLTGGRALASVRRSMAQMQTGGESVLSNALNIIEEKYDYVIIDTGPGWDSMTVNVLLYCHEILAPVSLEVLSLQALVEYQNNLTEVKYFNDDLRFAFVLPTFFDRRVRKTQEIFSQLETYFPEQICPPIRYNVSLSEAPGFGKHIFEFAPRSAGAADFKALIKKITATA